MYCLFLLLITLIAAPQACQAMNAELKVMRAESPFGTKADVQAELKRAAMSYQHDYDHATAETAELEENSDDDITPEMLIPDYITKSRLQELYHDDFGSMPLWQANLELIVFGKTYPTNQEPKEQLRLVQRLNLAECCKPEFHPALISPAEIAPAQQARTGLEPKYHNTIERYFITLINKTIDQLKNEFKTIKSKYPRAQFMEHAQDCTHKKIAEEFIAYTALADKTRAWINNMIRMRLNSLDTLWLEAVKKHLDADTKIDAATIEEALTINSKELAEMSHPDAQKAILGCLSATPEYPEYNLREKLYNMAENATLELLYTKDEEFKKEIYNCATGTQYINFITTNVHLTLKEELFIYPLLSEETIASIDAIISSVIITKTKIDGTTIFTPQDFSYEENYDDDDQGAEDGFQIAQACINKGAPV